jgi:TM2 domain-containing membrane protein YozV
MKYVCPVCGAKIKGDSCTYCKDVTVDRITGASNKKAKQLKKSGDVKDVVNSYCIPSDVNMTKLWIFTALLGWLGIHNFYVGKTIKGWFNLISYIGTFIFVTINELSVNYGWGVENGVAYFVSFFSFLAAVSFLMYIGDIILLLFKRFSVPVVLKEIEKPAVARKEKKVKSK